MLSLVLRVMAIVHIGLAVALVAAGLMTPTKPWSDLVARAVLWPSLALLCWSIADVRDRMPMRRGGRL